jgi:cytochrome c
MSLKTSTWFALAAALTVQAQTNWTSPLCPSVTPSAGDYQATELFNKKGGTGIASDPGISEPVGMDVHAVFTAGKYDHTDIIFTERMGNLKWYDGVAKTVKVMAHFSVHADNPMKLEDDNGLMGVVFDPAFDTNKWIYVWYSPKQTYHRDNVTPNNNALHSNRQLRLARLTVKPDNTVDTASQKILIKILADTTDTWHSGGPMQFDAYGDLWIAIGNNSHDLNPGNCDLGKSVLSQTDSAESAEWGPSDTHSMRGGFIRIHPDDAAPKGYTIPAGNFGQYWADKFEQQGRPAALVAQYRDPSKVLPEVYVKGERSNFSCAVHPTKRWLAWGTVNYNSSQDEFNITDHPIFSGYPYFMGKNDPTCNHGKSVDSATNTSPLNGGVKVLPPAIPGTLNNLVNVAIGGPIYSFDPSLDYEGKFPPYFDNKWLVTGFYGGVWGVTVDTTKQPFQSQGGTPPKMDATGGLFSGIKGFFRNVSSMKYGKDGALYLLNYDGNRYTTDTFNPGVVRIIYKGTCHPVSVGGKTQTPYQSIWFGPLGITIRENGPHMASLYDLGGHRVWNDQGMGPKEYRLNAIRARAALPPGLYLAKVTTPAGEVSQRISVF